MAIYDNGYMPALKRAFQAGRVTFYLGAGVSKPNGLPSWEELVQALYFFTLKDDSVVSALQPYPNYLFALSEWVLKQKNEPLDIITRKIKQSWSNDEFIRRVRETLYAGLGWDRRIPPAEIVAKNNTLEAILSCCGKSRPGAKGLASIITYNYDNLVEMALETKRGLKGKFQPVYKKQHMIVPGKIPIYHVHGYIPYYENTPVSYDEIIFSEEQYNNAFQDQFFWGNVVQLNQLISNVGVMIGLSLSDRNTRRILDAIRNQPLNTENYILIKKPNFNPINDPSAELDTIRANAAKYLSKFPNSMMKQPAKEPAQIQHLLQKIYEYEEHEFAKGFESLGLHIITFDDFSDLPKIIDKIARP